MSPNGMGCPGVVEGHEIGVKTLELVLAVRVKVISRVSGIQKRLKRKGVSVMSEVLLHAYSMSARKRSPNIAFRRVRLIRAVLFMTAIVVAASAQSDSASVIRAEAVPYGQGPDVSADRRITFHVRAPNAKQVTVGGLDGGLEPIPPLELRNDGSGNWSVTTPPLTPDIYTYGFLIDGVGFADPSNPHATTNLGVGPISIVRVPGSPSTPWDPQDVPHGIIAHHMFRSRVVNDNRDYYVYTPPNYDPRRRNAYPTLYLLNGMGGEARGWFDVGAAHVILDNLIGQGKAKPMVIVAPLA